MSTAVASFLLTSDSTYRLFIPCCCADGVRNSPSIALIPTLSNCRKAANIYEGKDIDITSIENYLGGDLG